MRRPPQPKPSSSAPTGSNRPYLIDDRIHTYTVTSFLASPAGTLRALDRATQAGTTLTAFSPFCGWSKNSRGDRADMCVLIAQPCPLPGEPDIKPISPNDRI